MEPIICPECDQPIRYVRDSRVYYRTGDLINLAVCGCGERLMTGDEEDAVGEAALAAEGLL